MKSLVDIILEEHGDNVEITRDQAMTIAGFIITEIEEDRKEQFIREDLRIFKTKSDVFDWFFDYEKEGRIDKDNVDIVITEDMVGRNLRDIMLDEQENYQEVDGLYLVWWM